MLKVLNLYSGIGGNRKLWGDVEVVAVENNPKIAKIYQESYPQDTVIIADAPKYLLKHYDEFDFIWSSPPCPTHSRARFWSSKGKLLEPVYPDMALWQEIIFLDNFCECKWVVENVVSYYPKFLNPTISGNHYFWSNFVIMPFRDVARKTDAITTKTTHYGFNLKDKDIQDKVKILRNLVNPKLGKHIFDCAFRIKQQLLSEVSGNSSHD